MKLPFFKNRRRHAALAGAVAALCAASGIAVAANSGDSTQHRIAAASATTPRSTPRAEASAFDVLRSKAQPVAHGVGQAFAHAPQYDGAFAPNPSLGRPLAHENPYTGTKAWIVPADDGVCLYVPDTVGSASTCATLDEAKAGALHLVMAPFGKPSVVVGVVPDGVQSVDAVKADGSTDKLDVTDNSYALRSASVRAIKIGGTTVQVPQAPKTPPAPPPAG
ncbi:MAG: hypothetical protein ACJ768_16815 [Gaiellaceae bacterium]